MDKLKRIPILKVLGGDTNLKRVTANEYAGPCPVCGGVDRFHVNTDRNGWFCSHCCGGRDKWHSTIDMVMLLQGVVFKAACDILASGNTAELVDILREPAQKTPSSEWVIAGGAVVEFCSSFLWSDRGENARLWLAARGLGEDILKKFSIGYNDHDQQIGDLWVYRGVIIPWYFRDRLWNLRVRRPNGEREKYRSISWSRESPNRDVLATGVPIVYGSDFVGRKAGLFITEGEFDCLLISQAAGDLVDVITFGSCSSKIDVRAKGVLTMVEMIYLAYDVDEPGQQGANKLQARYPRLRRVTPPGGGDITDSWLKGHDLRTWVENIIKKEIDSKS